MALITHYEGDVIGGIAKLEIAYHWDFTQFYPAVFAAGKDWKEIEALPETGELKYKAEETEHGPLYSYSGSFSVLKLSESVETAILPYIGESSILRITDNNGRIFIVGLPGAPVSLALSAGTGRKYTSQNSFDFDFSVEQVRPAVSA